MEIMTLVIGMVSTNCYIIADREIQTALVVDPAGDAEVILEKLNKEHLKLEGILLTHGHFDHILAVNMLRTETGAKVYASEAEKNLLEDPKMNCSVAVQKPYSVVPDVLLKDGQVLTISGFKLKVLATPGHTSGSVCYYFEQDKVLFSGDTLFFESIGRSDLPTGNGGKLLDSIREKIFTLPDEVKIFTGHGQSTMVSYEKKNNPYTDGNEFYS